MYPLENLWTQHNTMSYRQERSLQSVNLRHWWSINTKVGRFNARGAFYFWFLDTNIDKREVFCVWLLMSGASLGGQQRSQVHKLCRGLLPLPISSFLLGFYAVIQEFSVRFLFFSYKGVTWLQVCVCDWGISGFPLCQFLLVIWDIYPLLSWWLRPGLAYSFGHTK